MTELKPEQFQKTANEAKNCPVFLEKTINLINPKIIVMLGTVALEALKAIEYHQFTPPSDVAKILNRSGRHLIALYHQSPQVIASHRRENEQLEDFRILKQAIKLNNRGAGTRISGK